MIGATLFSGGRGVELLLRDMIAFRYAVEYDPQIAAVGAQLDGHTFVSRVEDVDYSLWGALDYLHASPVCKEYSQAKTNGAEGECDLSSAAAVVRCLEATQPRVFTLENVGAYQHGKAYRSICQALDRMGYMWHAEVLNAADYGVPQTRRRLILRAVRGALLPGLPPPARWVGWYEAIEDLIPTLPESAFAPWQLARLPAIYTTSLVDCTHRTDGDLTVRAIDDPSHTIASSHFRRPANEPRAFIVDGQTNDAGAVVTVPHGHDPMYTVSASCDRRPARAWLMPIGTESQVRYENEPAHTTTSAHYKNMPKGWLHSGRVVKMTPRALARFQSVPDWYDLPSKASLACTVIGNMAPPLLMQQIVEPLL